MPQSVDELIALLDLEEIEVGLYRARQPRSRLQRVFGGQVLAQALLAASRTVPADRTVHSLHAYFLVAGRTDLPIVYDVEAVRDGGSFSSRRVVARQAGKVIFYLSASFHLLEEGYEHADPVPEGVPAPEDCPRLGDALAKASGRSSAPRRRRGRRSGAPSTPATSVTPGWAACRSTWSTRHGLGSGSRRAARCPTTRGCTRRPWPSSAT